MNRRIISLTVLAAAFLVLLFLAPDVLLIVFAGILFAVFLHSGGAWIAGKTGVPHGIGVGAFLLVVVAALTGSILAFAPAIAEQFDQLTRQVPQAWESLRERVGDYSWGERLLERASPEGLFSSTGRTAAMTAVSSTFGALGNFVIILFIGLYGAISPGIYRTGLVALTAPSLRPRARQVLSRMAQTLRDWLAAQLLAMAVVGVLTALGLWLLGIPLALLLGLIAALLAFIPNIGPVLAAVPAVLLAVPQGTTVVLLVISVYLAVQTIESYVIVPLIQQEKISLPPALVLGTQLLMGVLFGLLGLALATPLTAILVTLTRETYVTDYLEAEDAPAARE
ncbi:AI-2E family transporter [Reyranella sp.]|jgi:predicted PurR-regulated permease PerM|uniref:AI-2E family transporter n=1 Tax=Reyranella sp. TaxID=1929291 RepID=UPI000BCF3CE8|nr:AI-2E family transporter [Reyranella sp.]OYY37129.1 MAG: AI-2E family transporter [Rhodospirillales bacterium 35-66-84]OYZ94100.1 MAG: AI-2E family transporter [Rhodospirillales bacterium 24-66-33]OZB22941.1 MAG: AI-2E family transporter [Rhodospirillales bacterium 39-66-50]HQS17112.1 AI-2E family transporter [Reyranella sp.]HQT13817.1 AI-2E family transporter [Reyranella sp.]